MDDYFLAEGTGLAERWVATPDGVENAGALDGDGYDACVAGLDLLNREPRGRLRTDAKAVRFAEVVVNGPNSWSLTAARKVSRPPGYVRTENGNSRSSTSASPVGDICAWPVSSSYSTKTSASSVRRTFL